MVDKLCRCGWPLPAVAIEVLSKKPPDLDIYGIVIVCPICQMEHTSTADDVEKMPKPC